jgi:hypothetical protein
MNNDMVLNPFGLHVGSLPTASANRLGPGWRIGRLPYIGDDRSSTAFGFCLL